MSAARGPHRRADPTRPPSWLQYPSSLPRSCPSAIPFLELFPFGVSVGVLGMVGQPAQTGPLVHRSPPCSTTEPPEPAARWRRRPHGAASTLLTELPKVLAPRRMRPGHGVHVDDSRPRTHAQARAD